VDVDAEAEEGNAEGSGPAAAPARARPLVLALVGWTVAAIVSGVVVGYLLSWSVFEPDPDIVFSSLATFFWSAVFGGLTGLAVLIVGTVRSVRRHVPEHRRTRTCVTFVGLTVVCAPTGPFALVASIPAAVLAAGLARRPRRWWPWLAVPAVVPLAVFALQRVDT
jgi:hypothetical protein